MHAKIELARIEVIFACIHTWQADEIFCLNAYYFITYRVLADFGDTAFGELYPVSIILYCKYNMLASCIFIW